MKISVITVTFNSSNTVRDTIESVFLQTHKDIEYIIIDGGSKDNTIDIVREYEAQYKGRLRWISEYDRGIYDAMNKGIARPQVTLWAYLIAMTSTLLLMYWQ